MIIPLSSSSSSSPTPSNRADPHRVCNRVNEKMSLGQAHVLVLPYPSQGHINPMLQFAKTLTHHGLTVTLAATRYILSTTNPSPGPVTISPISDGFDTAGFNQTGSVSTYLDQLASTGSDSIADLITSSQIEGRPFTVLVYDALLPWALDVGKRLGVKCAAFFTQSCAVDAIYCHVTQGRLTVPAATVAVELPGLPLLEPRDLPSFLVEEVFGVYPAYLALVLSQFQNLDRADVLLFNSFYELEPKELDWLKLSFPAMTIGPTIPSSYLTDQAHSEAHYGFDLYPLETGPCMAWLDSKPPASVVYVSFGSMAALNVEQMEEIAQGLENSKRNFLWVVRESDASKLPIDFLNVTSGRGLVVTWSPQLEVLAHGSVGCFVTHCGWNSVMEAICSAVPMVGVPQWTDQPTDAKYVEDVWKIGVRVKLDKNGLVRREELERCIGEVMEGERSEDMATNIKKWREMARGAMGKCGSSNNNILEFIEKYCSCTSIA